MRHKLNVGDKCRVVANTCSHGMEIGHESVIDSFESSSGYYVEGWAVDDDDVELIMEGGQS